MNNKKKALVSGLAGAALLLGAGGTFALWQDTQQLGATTGAQIAVGHLYLNEDHVVPGNAYQEFGVNLWRPGSTGTRVISLDLTNLGSIAGDGMTATLRFIPSPELVALSASSGNATTYHIDGINGEWTISKDFVLDGVTTQLTADGIVLNDNVLAGAVSNVTPLKIAVDLAFNHTLNPAVGADNSQAAGKSANLPAINVLGTFVLTQNQ